MDFGAFTLPSIRISKQLFRLLFLFLLLVFLVTQFSWAEGIYDRAFARPELRIFQYAPDSDINLDGTVRFQRIIVVQNRGRQSASEVFVSLYAVDGYITRHRVVSQEAWSAVNSSDSSSDSLALVLPRLAPDATVLVYIWGTSSNSASDPVVAAAVAESGAAKALSRPTALEESESYAARIVRAFQEAYHALRGRPDVQHAIETLSHRLPWSVVDTVMDQSFRTIAVAAVILIAIVWLFWSPTVFVSLLAVLATLFTWLFFDFSVTVPDLLIVAGMVSVFALIGLFSATCAFDRNLWLALFVFVPLSVGLSCLLHEPETWQGSSVSGSPIVGFGVFAVYSLSTMLDQLMIARTKQE